jgi:hypothetical protein
MVKLELCEESLLQVPRLVGSIRWEGCEDACCLSCMIVEGCEWVSGERRVLDASSARYI